ncbi:MAG: DUF1934 domain-containing protein [Ruminococcaceae bacterium]|nr:DUF1934 domain-containing protein [Oscillospiraceae bacterium]
MTKKVSITIDSTQTVDGESDKTELFTVGILEADADGYKLCYDESEATGFEGSSVTVKLLPDSVTVMRTGKAVSTLIIERGKKHHCHYGTEFGDFLIGVNTDEIKNNLTENGGEVYLKYTLDINSSLMSENEMRINVKEYN